MGSPTSAGMQGKVPAGAASGTTRRPPSAPCRAGRRRRILAALATVTRRTRALPPMRLRQPLPHIAATALAGALLAACGDEKSAYDRAAGFYTLATVDGREIPAGVQTVPGGGGVFLQRGTMQLQADGRFALGLEKSYVGSVTGPQFEFLNGRYALTASDTTLTLRTEPDGQVLTGTITQRRITVRLPVALLAFARP